MAKIVENSLIIRKESKFDKIRKNLFMIFFKEQYYLSKRIDKLVMPKRPNKNDIVIPKEIKYKK